MAQKWIPAPPNLAGQEVPSLWTPFEDYLERKQEKMRKTRYTQPEIRDLNELDLEKEDFRMSTLELRGLQFSVPSDASGTKALLSNIMSISLMCQETVKILRQPLKKKDVHGQELKEYPLLGKTERERLLAVRRELFLVLYSNSPIIWKPVSFSISFVETIGRVDVEVFTALMQVSRCLWQDSANRSDLGLATCGHANFQPLRDSNIIPGFIDLDVAIANFTGEEILRLLNYMQKIWTQIQFLKELAVLLDLLLVRVAVLALQLHPAKFYYGDHRKAARKNLYGANSKMIEDFCWTMIPLYKSLVLRETLCNTITMPSFPVLDSEAVNLQNILTKFVRDSARTTLQQTFQVYYFNYAVTDGERRRMVRDFPNVDPSNSKILEYIHPKGEKEEIMEKLGCVPWIIIEKELFPQNELDVLLMLMFNTYLSTKVSANLDWINRCAHFNFELKQNPDPLKFINREYPVIVQHFSGFGVFADGMMMEFPSGMHALVHWIGLIFLPPFNGFLPIDGHTFNFVKINSLVPLSVQNHITTVKRERAAQRLNRKMQQ